MYINKENTKYKSVALQGRTTDTIWSRRRVLYIRSPSLFINSLQQLLSLGECEDSLVTVNIELISYVS